MNVKTRYTIPGRFDYKEEGTVVKVASEDGYDYYIQISEYKELPDWKKWGDFLNLTFKEKALDENFVSECVNIFKSNSTEKTINLEDILI